jgi:hypothetical protein
MVSLTPSGRFSPKAFTADPGSSTKNAAAGTMTSTAECKTDAIRRATCMKVVPQLKDAKRVRWKDMGTGHG